MKYIAIVTANEQFKKLLRLQREVYQYGKRSFMCGEISNADECNTSFDVKAIYTGRIVFGIAFEDEDDTIVIDIARRHFAGVESMPYTADERLTFQEL